MFQRIIIIMWEALFFFLMQKKFQNLVFIYLPSTSANIVNTSYTINDKQQMMQLHRVFCTWGKVCI